MQKITIIITILGCYVFNTVDAVQISIKNMMKVPIKSLDIKFASNQIVNVIPTVQQTLEPSSLYDGKFISPTYYPSDTRIAQVTVKWVDPNCTKTDAMGQYCEKVTSSLGAAGVGSIYLIIQENGEVMQVEQLRYDGGINIRDEKGKIWLVYPTYVIRTEDNTQFPRPATLRIEPAKDTHIAILKS